MPSLVAEDGSRTLNVRCSPNPRWSEIGVWAITFRTAGFFALVLSNGNTPFRRSRIEVSAICSWVNCRMCRNPYGAEPSRTIEPAASSFGSGEKTFASRTSGPTLSGSFTASGSVATSTICQPRGRVSIVSLGNPETSVAEGAVHAAARTSVPITAIRGRWTRMTVPLSARGAKPRGSRSGPEGAVFEGDRQRDRRSGCDADLLAEEPDQLLELPGGSCPHLQDVVRLTGDAVAVLDLREVREPLRQVVRLFGVQRRGRDERSDEEPDGLGSDDRAIPADHARLLQLAHPVVDRGGRQAHPLSHVRIGRSCVFLQGRHDLQIAFVEHRHIVGDGVGGAEAPPVRGSSRPVSCGGMAGTAPTSSGRTKEGTVMHPRPVGPIWWERHSKPGGGDRWLVRLEPRDAQTFHRLVVPLVPRIERSLGPT